MYYDSVANKLGGVNANQTYFTISNGASSLTNANWYDTTASGEIYRRVKLPTPLTCAAGNLMGVTVTFKSGDASFVANDTVFTGHAPGTYRYNMWRPWVWYETGSSASTTAVFATYTANDHNVGLLKTLPNFSNGWGNRYVPEWAWSGSGGVASTYQQPWVDMHVKCPTCIVEVANVNEKVNSVKAYPNPAEEELNISFSLISTGNVTVTLSNMLGQVVATQNMGNISYGKAVFNTAALPSGLYVYTVQNNGTRSTGRVVVAH